MELTKFVCAFPGSRDNYQVPVALAERELLELFLTDFYWKDSIARLGRYILPRGVRERAVSRRHKLIPDDKVRSLLVSTTRRELGRLSGKRSAVRYSEEGIRFSNAAADEARRRGADLFLYPPCAYEAFRANYPRHQPRRVLFQFHPHPAYQERVLREDYKKYPEVAISYRDESWHDLPDSLKVRDNDAWQDADVILCASSFTLRTVVEAGADPARCHVVTYGTETVNEPVRSVKRLAPGFHVLFVGNATQRKGIHHLIAAWNKAMLPTESSLTVVSRQVDPGLRATLRASKRTKVHEGGLSYNDLQTLYQTSTLFAMPSLIEGFGAVFLEALRCGCPVLGTSNTCLPDLGSEQEGVYLCPLGDIDALVGRLEHLGDILPRDSELRRKARACAIGFTWHRFRAGVIGTLERNMGVSPAP